MHKYTTQELQTIAERVLARDVDGRHDLCSYTDNKGMPNCFVAQILTELNVSPVQLLGMDNQQNTDVDWLIDNGLFPIELTSKAQHWLTAVQMNADHINIFWREAKEKADQHISELKIEDLDKDE